MSTVPPNPHSFWFHPDKSWTDIFVSLLITWFLPFRRLVDGPPPQVTAKEQQKIQKRFMESSPKNIQSAMAKWKKALGQDIVEVTLHIPRRPDILQKWGFQVKNIISLPEMPTGPILVTLRMPQCACPEATALASKGTNEFGCKTLDSIDWAQLDPKTPFCLSFHAGGLTLGTRHDGWCHDMAVASSIKAQKPILWAAVEYSLAPQYTFPTAPAEALTVLSFLMEHMPKERNFHVMGISAGGNLATVTAMELARVHRLSSLLASVPMIDPAADSVSMYMNSTSSYAPTAWLRWCWQCYLALPATCETEKILSLPTLEQRLAHNSNRSTWAASPWRSSGLARLVDPTLDLPDSSFLSIPIIIHTNRGDPLHDDGITLLRALEKQGVMHVNHLDHRGSHFLGTMLDSKLYQEVVETWKEMLFGPSL